MAITTTIPQEKELLPKKLQEKTVLIATNKLPIIKFLGLAKGLSSRPKRITV